MAPSKTPISSYPCRVPTLFLLLITALFASLISHHCTDAAPGHWEATNYKVETFNGGTVHGASEGNSSPPPPQSSSSSYPPAMIYNPHTGLIEVDVLELRARLGPLTDALLCVLNYQKELKLAEGDTLPRLANLVNDSRPGDSKRKLAAQIGMLLLARNELALAFMRMAAQAISQISQIERTAEDDANDEEFAKVASEIEERKNRKERAKQTEEDGLAYGSPPPKWQSEGEKGKGECLLM